MLYLDTETCGLHGFAVLIQYAIDDGPIMLFEPWCNPVQDTIDLIEMFLEHEICGFNLAFDAFHICKLYTTFILINQRNKHPEDLIPEIVEAEERARFSNVCIKPKGCLDLMLLARRGKLQSLMAREDIRIKRVPTSMSWSLARELEARIQFDNIYFAKQKDKNAPRWKIYDVKKDDGTIDPDFKTIKLKFRASGALKNLARHAFKLGEPVLFRDIEVDRQFLPAEFGFAPFAKAVYWARDHRAKCYNKRCASRFGAWDKVIREHIIHWRFNSEARKYAENDITLTRRLHLEYFNNAPAGDDDSELAWCVAACRWHGYAVDIEALKSLRTAARLKITNTPTSPAVALKYLKQVVTDPAELMVLKSTKRKILEEMTRDWKDDSGKPTLAAERAQEILSARQAQKEVELYDKLILGKRLHAGFVVVGALSGRMSGSDGLNAMGINHDKAVRAVFTLADNDYNNLSLATGIDIETLKDLWFLYSLCGGDFKSFEVSIAATVFDDANLIATLKSGRKIHALLAMELYPEYTYEQILESDGHPHMFPEGDMYDTGKKGVFLMFYGGDENTFHNKLGIPLIRGKPALVRFKAKYPGIDLFFKKVVGDFGALRQPGGIGTRVEWHEPKDYAETLLGFRRYFTLENRIAKELFKLANEPLKAWKALKIKVSRRAGRIQTGCGAIQSALYGAAFAIVSGTIRAVQNHYIQGTGAAITKAVQRAIWNLQPSGVHMWRVQPMNVHDEIMNPTKQGMESEVELVVKAKVGEFTRQIPLLAIDWFNRIPNWSSKKGVAVVES